MKYVLFSLAIFLLAVSSIQAQSEEDIAPVLSDTFFIAYKKRVVYEMFDIEQPPKYPGGEKELLKYMMESIQYPAVTKDSYMPGPFAVYFIVEADGTLSNKKVIRTNAAFAQAVLKGIDQMPRWLPGMKNGEAVAVQFVLPIRLCYLH